MLSPAVTPFLTKHRGVNAMQSNGTRPKPHKAGNGKWTAPELRRLATSEAEFGAAADPDAEGAS